MVDRLKGNLMRFRGIAQLVEQRSPKPRAEGSNPSAPAIKVFTTRVVCDIMLQCRAINGPVVQLVRTLACHARGRRFEPVPGRHSPRDDFISWVPTGVEIPRRTVTVRERYAQIAQLVEQWTENPRVAGSIPAGGTNSVRM